MLIELAIGVEIKLRGDERKLEEGRLSPKSRFVLESVHPRHRCEYHHSAKRFQT